VNSCRPRTAPHRPRTSLQTKDRETDQGPPQTKDLAADQGPCHRQTRHCSSQTATHQGRSVRLHSPQFQRADFTVNEYATLRSLLFYFPALVSSCLPSSPVHLLLSFLPLSSFSSHLVFSPVEDAAGFSASMDGRCLVVLDFNFTSYIDAYLTFLFCQCSVFIKSLNSRQILKMPTADAFKMK